MTPAPTRDAPTLPGTGRLRATRRGVTVMAVGALLTLSLACGGKDEEAGGEPALPEPAVQVSAAPEAHPETEAELVERFTAALERQDLDALGRFVAPELGADLRRMHSEDAGVFWGRGERWVTNVRTGFAIASRQEGRTDRWRALLRFESGEEETVVFGRVDGRLVFFEL